MNRRIAIEFAGEELTLDAGKGIWWQRRSTLFIADSHFGKAATFRRAGLAVPQGTTLAALRRLDELLLHYQAQKLTILGDFVHSAIRTQHDFEADLTSWRDRWPALEITLIRGNHDRVHKSLFETLRIQVENEPYRDGSIELCHRPEAGSSSESMVLAGHVHPGVHLKHRFNDRVKLSCFHISRNCLVLPAFGEFTGLSISSLEPDDIAYAIVDQELIRISSQLV